MKCAVLRKMIMALCLLSISITPVLGGGQTIASQKQQAGDQGKSTFEAVKKYVREHALKIGAAAGVLGLVLVYSLKNRLLEAAIRRNNVSMTNALIAIGANGYGFHTPFHIAIEQGNAHMALLLIDQVDLTHHRAWECLLRWGGGVPTSMRMGIAGRLVPFCQAIANNDVAFLKLLHKFDVDLKFYVTGHTGDRFIVEDSVGSEFPTALNYAANCGAADSVECLVGELKQSVHTPNWGDQDKTPLKDALYWAREGKKFKMTGKGMNFTDRGILQYYTKEAMANRPVESWDRIIAFLESKGASTQEMGH